MIYFDKINSGEFSARDEKANLPRVRSEQEIKIVPVGQKKEDKKTEDIEKLPQGYRVEKSQDVTASAPAPEPTSSPLSENDDDEDDKIDTNVDPDRQVSLSESIVIPGDETKPVDDVLENAARRGQNSMLSNENITSLDKAESMTKDNPFKPLDDQDFKKGFNVAGLARFELNNQKVNIDETGAEIRVNTSAQRVDLKATYVSKSGNTKLFSYLKGAITNRHLITETANDSENEVQNEDELANDFGNEAQNEDESVGDKIDSSKKLNEYCAYFGLKQKFNNGNILSATAFHNHNEAEFSKTTAIDAKYNLGIANVQGSSVIYKLGTSESVKTNLSCKFNTFDDDKLIQEVTPSNEEEKNVQNDVEVTEPLKQNNKKFERKSGLFIEFESEDDTEQGLGYHWDLRKLAQNSKTKYGFFAKGSTTQRRIERSSYHITAGANLKCSGSINPKTKFNADLDTRYKSTFGGDDRGYIFTSFGHARIMSPKAAVELEGCAVYTNDGRRNEIVLRGAYKPNKTVVLFGEGGYLSEEQQGVLIQNATLRAGISFNLK